MISKIFLTGKSFGSTCRYLCEDLARSEVLAVEGVRGHDFQLMQEDFEVQHQFMPEKEKPVFHAVLSYPHGEDPGKEKIVEIGRKYLQEIEMANTQYAMVQHTDKKHLHVHILANRVNNDGKIIGQGLIVERGIKAAQKLTKEYGLKPENGKNLAETNIAALHEPDAKRYRLYLAIRDNAPGCQRLEDLEARLLENGISTRYRYDPASHERVGISFRSEGLSFKGSQVDAAYSLKNLERTMAENRRLSLKQQKEKEALEKLEQANKLKLELELKQKLEKEMRSKLQREATPSPKEDETEEQTQSLGHSHRRGLRM